MGGCNLLQVFANAWAAIEPAHNFLFALSLSLVTAALLSFFRPRVKIIWGSTSINFHKFSIVEGNEPVVISTEKLFVQNVGKQAAKSVELVLSDVPSSYSLWSPREHKSGLLEGGGFTINIPSLAPGELLIVDTIDIDRRNVRLVAVNSPDTVTKEVQFQAQRQYGRLFLGFIAYLMFAGLLASFYLAIVLIFRTTP